jgi:hypothetical protein
VSGQGRLSNGSFLNSEVLTNFSFPEAAFISDSLFSVVTFDNNFLEAGVGLKSDSLFSVVTFDNDFNLSPAALISEISPVGFPG